MDKGADYWSSLCSWNADRQIIGNTFSRQAIPMVWSYAECNPFSQSSGNWTAMYEWIARFLENIPQKGVAGNAQQRNAINQSTEIEEIIISTDPPYYDNIGYADLSDFFYVWLRRNLRNVQSDLFKLMLVPKSDELVATPHRFCGDKKKAEVHFLKGLGKAFNLMRGCSHPDYPMTVYYAFKQSERDKKDGSITSTGWETMLEGLLKAGFQITSTLPMRTERPTGMKISVNALASSIVLACRPRPNDAVIVTRRDFIAALRRELPDALRRLQEGNIAPVDLAQAAIGPGMAVFSRYSKVLESGGTPMRVRTALQIINSELDAYFAAQEGDLDPDTRFCTAWFEQYGMTDGTYGEAEILAHAKNSSVAGVAETGVLRAGAGKVRLISRDEYPADWNPTSDSRLNTWKCSQYLIRSMDEGGEVEAGKLVNRLGGGPSEDARGLAYRLYAICEQKGWAQEAVAYNTLVTSWPHIQDQAKAASEQVGTPQQELF